MENIIRIENLKKSYGKNTVLDGISFNLGKGEITGLLGPNGSGKTTLIKIITGLIKDHEGQVLIDSQKPGVHSKSLIAYLPDRSYLPDWMKPVDAINYFADFFADFDKQKALEIMPRFGVDLNQRLKTMSKGQQEKVNLILVFCRKAKIYVLDEPLGGLDPAARGAILDFIVENRSEDSTILLSTHLVNDIESIFTRVLMINSGKLIVNSDIDEIRKTGKSLEDVFKEVFPYVW
ncbi:MAG: ABC transporter ATP-binding protein [Clostridia bacterium]|nr:ABC transporter ATP-binding protein [Oscillospiraceae bacterium]MBQ7006159.1 ABC transporter ATP-binding protein [Clostridia bacterium]